MARIAIEGARRAFADGTRALDDVSLAVGDGEFLVLVGPSGCGKSTLLRAVAGLERLDAGRVLIGDADVTGKPAGERDIAIGNLIGSSVYNILVILGVTCLVPAGGVAVSSHLIRVDIPVMLGVALLCIPVFVSGREISRWEGGLFVGAYAAYLGYLIMQRT